MLQAEQLNEVINSDAEIEIEVAPQDVSKKALSFAEVREQKVFEKALEIEKAKHNTYGSMLKSLVVKVAEITQPSEASLEEARNFIDNLYMQHSLTSRASQEKAELEAIMKGAPLPRADGSEVDDLAKALSKTLHIDQHTEINQVIGSSNLLTPFVLNGQIKERMQEVDKANQHRKVSGPNHLNLESSIGAKKEAGLFSPYNALVQQRARKEELNKTGSSHDTKVAQLRRLDSIDQTLENFGFPHRSFLDMPRSLQELQWVASQKSVINESGTSRLDDIEAQKKDVVSSKKTRPGM